MIPSVEYVVFVLNGVFIPHYLTKRKAKQTWSKILNFFTIFATTSPLST